VQQKSKLTSLNKRFDDVKSQVKIANHARAGDFVYSQDY
jgi:hypothetical protein